MTKKTGLDLISDERKRQMHEEGWTAEHDMKHTCDELAKAAACYAVGTTNVCSAAHSSDGNYVFKNLWPWDKKSDKRNKHSRLKQLAIAGALIAAEIDRLQQ